MVLRDAVGHLLVAADQGGACPAAHESDAGPEVRGDLELVRATTVQRGHPALALRLGRLLACLRFRDLLGAEPLEQSIGLLPGLLRGRTADDVQSDTEADLATDLCRTATHSGDLLGDLRRRLAPGEVDIGVLRGDVDGGGGGTTEESPEGPAGRAARRPLPTGGRRDR